MPKAWLLLLRFWLRVDGSMVRLRETRLFCRCWCVCVCVCVVDGSMVWMRETRLSCRLVVSQAHSLSFSLCVCARTRVWGRHSCSAAVCVGGGGGEGTLRAVV